MKRFINSLWAIIALAILPGFALAQAQTKPLATAGYTDGQGKALPGGDTRMTVTSDGKTTTMKLSNLYAYGEANIDPKDPKAERKAWYGSNKAYFQGGTVYAMKLGNDWRGSRTATSVDLKADNGLAILASGKVGDDEVTLTFGSRRAGPSVRYECQPLNYLLVRADGSRAWLGQPGWKTSNTEAGIGDHMVLVSTPEFPNGDGHYPATAVCYDANGQIVKLTPEMRAELAKVIQPPADYNKSRQTAKKRADD